MAWIVGTQRYRGRAVRGEAQIARNVNGTLSAEVMLEVTSGPQEGQRIRYRGYISGAGGAPSPKNAETTAGELRAMGVTGQRFGDWSGLGGKECEFTVLADAGTREDGSAVTYYRACFVRAPAVLNKDRAVDVGELDTLPAMPMQNGRAPGAVPVAADAADEANERGGEIPF